MDNISWHDVYVFCALAVCVGSVITTRNLHVRTKALLLKWWMVKVRYALTDLGVDADLATSHPQWLESQFELGLTPIDTAKKAVSENIQFRPQSSLAQSG
jgi:hypothetical protein